jgi:EmrB/QacA subfamily drug resistance transporter
VIGYLLALAVVIPASGWIGDRFGTKRTFVLALVLFTGASALCSRASSLTELVLFRALQGVGGGMLNPVGTSMLFRAYPPSERAKASAVLLTPAVIAPALGPVVGGIITTNWSWRWIFYVNVPLGVLGVVFAATMLKEHTEPTAGRIDIPGMVLSGAGLSMTVYALSEGPVKGWTSTSVVVFGVIGMLSLCATVFVELRVRYPLLALRLLQDKMFRTANLVIIPMYIAVFGNTFLLPLYFQDLRGMSAQGSGLMLLPQSVGMMMATSTVGRYFYPRFGPRRLIVVGMSLSALSLAFFPLITIGTSLWLIGAVLLLRGVIIPTPTIPAQTAAYATISSADSGRASSLYLTTRQISGALGVALAATVVTSVTNNRLTHAGTDPAAQAHAHLTGFRWAFGIGVVSSLVAVVIGRHVDDALAAPTLKRR